MFAALNLTWRREILWEVHLPLNAVLSFFKVIVSVIQARCQSRLFRNVHCKQNSFSVAGDLFFSFSNEQSRPVGVEDLEEICDSLLLYQLWKFSPSDLCIVESSNVAYLSFSKTRIILTSCFASNPVVFCDFQILEFQELDVVT